MNILIVAAHPDDEVLGCGGTINRHVNDGDDVYIVFMSDGVTSRIDSDINTDLQIRNHSASKASKILGAKNPQFLGFPDNRMDTIAFLDIVQDLERVINKIMPTVVYTHHFGDLNIDHKITHQAVMTACRPQPNFCVRKIFSFEVLSSTEWVAPSNDFFIPNYFADVSSTIEQKINALHAYEDEMREFPHSRSYESVMTLAKYRGSSVGMVAAEAFRVERFLN